MKEHGNRNIIPYVMIGKKSLQVKMPHIPVPENHFRIIPADVSAEEEFSVNNKGHKQRENKKEVFINYLSGLRNHLVKIVFLCGDKIVCRNNYLQRGKEY
jgi:hypothetical protein